MRAPLYLLQEELSLDEKVPTPSARKGPLPPDASVVTDAMIKDSTKMAWGEEEVDVAKVMADAPKGKVRIGTYSFCEG